MGETIYNKPIITNESMSENIISDVTPLALTNGYSISAVWTGSPVGTLKIQVSRDNIIFSDYPGSQISLPNGNTDQMWEITTANYSQVQLVYTYSSGSGTLSAGILGKGDLLS